MIKYLSLRKKRIAFFCCALFLFQIICPSVALALTGGPAQPEFQGFQSATTSEMVDIFSGDFSYNIPLFELPGPNGGYPFNLSYQSGIGMDQEASWVGLGWSLSPGSITRQMRGLPDEFKGDDIKTKMSIKPSVTAGLGAGASLELFGGDGISLKVGFSVSHNSYKGLGYSIDNSLGFARSVGGGMTGGIGLDLSLDSKEGVSMQPSLSLSGKVGEIGLNAGYNSKSGLSNISYYHAINGGTLTGKGARNSKGVREDKPFKASFSSSSTLSLAHPGYTPQILMPMRNLNLAAEFKPGGSWWGIFGNFYIRGFYNEQRLDNDKKTVTTDAYGYLNYQYAADNPKAVLDFNREKDGMVTKESPNLSIPSLSYDIYSVMGQGISATYRPMRNDYGVIYDQQTSSVSNGGSVGVDVGSATSHIGVNLGLNHSKSTSGSWNDNNHMNGPAKFQTKNLNDRYEPWYFKVHGEPGVESLDAVSNIGGDDAVRVELITPDGNIEAKANNYFENATKTFKKEAPKNATDNRERKSRNQVIQPVTNEQLLVNGQEILPEFRIRYQDIGGTEQTFSRVALPKHHVAGFTATTAEGLRYNYGLPAYNTKQEEVTFSAYPSGSEAVSSVPVTTQGSTGDPKFNYDVTDELLKSVELPRYTHSHLLTSIIGPDYVDLTGNGVSHDDLGYWVKFTYKQTATESSPYKWRDPFSKAHYQAGWISDPRDDKGSFVYGEKEMWYLAKAETKTHISVFTIAGDRTDGKGVLNKLQDTQTTGAAAHRLTEIKLYTRSTNISTPDATGSLIKTVKFDHDYSRCTELYGVANGPGKLTLKKVWFEYGGSTRGSLNPYSFTYSNVNPKYDNLAYDRWGNYKPYPKQPESPKNEFDQNRDFPYVDQNPANKATLDANASAWSLTEIVLPSGGKVIVDYESDDYGYVQHKPAMQMMEIVDPRPTPDFNSLTFPLEDNLLKVRFKLESKIISSTLTDAQKQAEVRKYLDLKRNQVYFKLKINLRTVGEAVHEYISGYANIQTAPETMGLETAPGGPANEFVYGYFHVVKEEGNGHNYHPFSMRTWQHLRTNQPEFANSGRKLKQTDNKSDRVDQIKSLGSVGTQVRVMFQGFYDFCNNKVWGRHVVAGKSWVRLVSPDKIKYGGGLRVRQITMKDQWAEDQEGTYGQVYEYTMKENGATISSGVAAYEPIVGGDENPLRYAKSYVQSVPLRADNNLFFEYPVNETYYPGPHVGYRKVTVWSLAAASLAGLTVKNTLLSNGKNLFPTGTGVGYGTTGKTEHEFYTAKDFPVITSETNKVNKPYRLSVPIPFLGSIAISRLATSQGYSIITNDMHGKPKMVSNYRQDKNGIVEPEPISWVKYNYLSEQKVYDKEVVNNLVNVLEDNGDNTLSIDGSTNNKFTIGQETEFFTDMRQYEDRAWSGGAKINLDIVYVPIAFVLVPVPVPVVWPSISKTQNLLRMSVTNKVIFKSGLLVSTEAYDGGSKMITKNEKWDKLTGVPVLTTTNNNFDAPVYNYSIFAFSQYAGMGAAYQNTGLSFDISAVTKDPDPLKNGVYDFYTPLPDGVLYPGDEFILYEPLSDLSKPLAKAVYTGNRDGGLTLFTQQQLLGQDYSCLIVRSGYRNQLSVTAGTITALQDPSKKGTPVTYTKTVTIAK